MDKLDQILDLATKNQKQMADFNVRFDRLDSRIDKLESGLAKVEDTVAKTDVRLAKVEDVIVDINTRLIGVEERWPAIGEIHEMVSKTYSKIDEFLVILNRHESEMAAVRMKYERLEERVTTLESQPKT